MSPRTCELNGICEERQDALEQRIEHVESDLREQGKSIHTVAEAVANLKGYLTGLLAAATIVGAGLAILFQKAVHG